jgi:mono/diheme cytochrome c family protein
MTPALLIVGLLMIFWASTWVAVLWPQITMPEQPSSDWLPWTPQEEKGNQLYVANGCSYCHSQFIRTIDQGIGAYRIAHMGDYYRQQPIILGTERTGPDLSQAGGLHPDDWHRAHFYDPRTTRPMSVMPNWAFLGEDDINTLTAFIQGRFGKNAKERMDRQEYWRPKLLEAWRAGPDYNVEYLHSLVPRVWREMPNPYPAEGYSLQRGKKTYQDYCINCHGPVGDGEGFATQYFRDSPPPLNFTILRRHLVEGKYIGGIFYYQIMNGVTGSAMPFFKHELESEKIWDVSNYVAVQFVGYTDADIPPRGIDASYEASWVNPYKPPQTATAPAAASEGDGK